jgi:hypothetical protein
MISNIQFIYIKESWVGYRIYNLRTARPIFMISDFLDFGKNKDNYLDK